MMNVKNTIISKLYKHICKPIIPNTDTENRPIYPFCDYAITTLIAFDGEGNNILGDSGVNISNRLDIQPKISISFNAYSDNESEAYKLAKDIWDYFKHIGAFELSLKDIIVVDVMRINNRTMLEVDSYENRYGLDVIFRYKESIDRVDLIIQDYSIEGGIN